MKEKPDCEACRAIKERHNEEPDCETCIPTLDEENEDVYRVYNLVSNQLIIAGMGDPIDVNLPAVEVAMRMLSVPKYREKEVFLKAIHVVRYFLKGYREEKVEPDMIAQARIKEKRGK